MKQSLHGFSGRRLAVKIPNITAHILFGAIFITYEITLAAAILKKFDHFLDYLLHYTVYVGMFYFHSYYVLSERKRMKWLRVSMLIIAELLAFCISSVLISTTLKMLGITPKWSFDWLVFLPAVMYRGIYIIGAATAFWYARTAIQKAKSLHRMRYANLVAGKEREKLRADLAEIEAAYLRAQINPHALLNALTGMYNTARKLDHDLSEQILSLAEMMRYSLNAGLNEMIPLEDELAYIERCIQVHQSRFPASIILKKDGTTTDFQTEITPLLLITIVENVLKHGDLSNPSQPALISISCRNRILEMQTENRINPNVRKGHGIGLKNLQKRLVQTYPGRHTYTQFRDDNIYRSTLTIQLNELC